MRACGVLLPVSSIPSRFGIGGFSKEAYEFVDQLSQGGQTYWQMLPLGPTSYGDSPYQSFSTFAGNPYFIDLERFIRDGLLTEDECEAFDVGDNPSYVEYEKIYQSRFLLLRKAYDRYNCQQDQEFGEFVRENGYWLEDYCLFMAIKDEQGGVSWSEWPVELKNRQPGAIQEAKERLEEEIQFYRFQQYMFYKQWFWLKNYANQNGIQIIGDIPIYVAFDSADTWAKPQLFQFDEENQPIAVAGCPPDYFSPLGQLWGNPLYSWEYHRETGYSWWFQRIEQCFSLYDVVRIDHFRGFDEYYSIPYGNPTAEYGHWEKGPGVEFFHQLHDRFGDLNIIAEDLGFMTDTVRQLVKETGFPNMKILEFAFQPDGKSDYLPFRYGTNCVVYTGTHDNDTLRGWCESTGEDERQFMRRYLNNSDSSIEDTVKDIIRLAISSVADMAIIPMQDYLCLGNEARINMPSTLGDNWKWRLRKEQITRDTVEFMHELAWLYGRVS